MRKIKENSLYLVISEECGRPRSALEIAGPAIEGGADILQMREKNKARPELTHLGRALSQLCRDRGSIFIVNDDPVLAMEVNASGVHLGQDDIKRYPIKEARRILGRDKIIGVSTHSIDEFRKANDDDVDYIAFGPVFPTKTKDYFIGTKDIKSVLQVAKKPVFFIGGINISNVDELLRLGAKNIALIRDILEAEDIKSKVISFKKKLTRTKGERQNDYQDKR